MTPCGSAPTAAAWCAASLVIAAALPPRKAFPPTWSARCMWMEKAGSRSAPELVTGSPGWILATGPPRTTGISRG